MMRYHVDYYIHACEEELHRYPVIEGHLFSVIGRTPGSERVYLQEGLIVEKAVADIPHNENIHDQIKSAYVFTAKGVEIYNLYKSLDKVWHQKNSAYM